MCKAKDFLDMQRLGIHVGLAIVREAGGQDALHLGELARGVGMGPQVVAKREIVAPQSSLFFNQVNVVCARASTPLFFAVARARNSALVKLLIDRRARPASAPGGGLFAAGWWEDLANLKLLIRAGAPVDVVVGVTPFLACWCWKRFEAAKCLALNGANVNHQDPKGRTALHHGIEKQFDPTLLRWLVNHGASPDVTDRQGISPRVKASRKRDMRFLG